MISMGTPPKSQYIPVFVRFQAAKPTFQANSIVGTEHPLMVVDDQSDGADHSPDYEFPSNFRYNLSVNECSSLCCSRLLGMQPRPASVMMRSVNPANLRLGRIIIQEG